MSNVTADQVLSEIAQLKQTMLDETKTLGERFAKAEKLAEDAVEGMKQIRRELPIAGAPPTDVQAAYAGQRGGLFDGKFRLKFERMLGLSPRSPVLLPRDSERLKALQDLHDACAIRYWMERRGGASRGEAIQKMWDDENNVDFRFLANHLEAAGYIRAANDILNPGGGAGVNLDFTLLTSQLIDRVAIESVVGSQFETKPLTRAKQEWPALRDIPKSRLGGGFSTYAVPAPDPDSVGTFPQATMRLLPTFGQVNFSCVHNDGAILYNDDIIEDSVVPLLDTLRSMPAVMIAAGRDDAIINGTRTGTTHIDSDVTATYDMRKAWHGLRYVGVNNKTGADRSAGPIVALDFNILMKRLGKWARNPANLRMILHVKDWLILASDPDLRTANTIGIDRATLRKGIVDEVFGVGIVVSGDVRRDLAVDGEYDGVTTNNTIEILVDTTRFWLGQRHGPKVEEQRVMQALGNWIQVDVREDFKPVDLDDTASPFQFAAGDAPVAIAVDVTAS